MLVHTEEKRLMGLMRRAHGLEAPKLTLAEADEAKELIGRHEISGSGRNRCYFIVSLDIDYSGVK